MENLIFSLCTFVVIYLFYLFFIILRNKKLEKFKDNTYLQYVIRKNQIDINKINFKVLANILVLTNSFIIAIAVFIISFIPDNNANYLLFKLAVAFVILVPFTLLMYNFIGFLYRDEKNKIVSKNKTTKRKKE